MAPWGWVCTAVAVALTLAGLALTLVRPAVAGPSRYERRPAAAVAPSAAPGAATGSPTSTAADGADRADGGVGEPSPLAPVDDWDALTRGEDPSR
ncbi:Trp biosynthesis-associated membrane protein [Serinibacter arcticus]|uniref:Trp biosynthesis-associated membrane protein n=1 Tax=Serinibacter arcticus TaxID=1655435 RepID=UPI0022A6E261|nr:Trp biosynthesis-associated membrane protein [Serinibacter arcticus]